MEGDIQENKGREMNARQRGAIDRLSSGQNVKTVAARPAEPQPADIARREAATAKMLATRALNGRVNTWVAQEPAEEKAKRKYVRREGRNR